MVVMMVEWLVVMKVEIMVGQRDVMMVVMKVD
jgi:hypothetical protein